MYGKCPRDGAGSVAVGRVVRSASNVAIVTGGVPVGDTGGGVRGGVTVGGEMGESLPGASPIGEKELPASADIRLLRDGQVIARSHDRRLEFTTGVPGIYRVEVYRRYRLRQRAWIFSNPIYVF